MKSKVKVAIIGAGTAGLTALKQVRRSTSDFVLINQPPWGTTCARVGCMPSKTLLQVAKDYHRGRHLTKAGIRHGEALSVDLPAVLRHVRTLRDRFVAGVLHSTTDLGERGIAGHARFIGPTTLRVDDHAIEAEHIIIATGSRPAVPAAWQRFGDRILTSDNLFEQSDLPRRIGVLGLGAIGVELTQALAWLDIEISGFDLSDHIAGITDPEVNQTAVAILGRDVPLHLGRAAELEEVAGGLRIHSSGQAVEVGKVLAALGRRPNVEGLGLETLGVELDARGMPPFDPQSLRIGELPIYLAGDVSGLRPLQHEAADEGRIASYQSLDPAAPCLTRRAPLAIVFSEPNVARAGLSWRELQGQGVVIGTARFENQSRAVTAGRNQGCLRIYADPADGRLLGAEMAIPDGEHLAHLLAWVIQRQLTVHEVLQLPFYHPSIVEGLRSALQDARKQLAAQQRVPDLPMCGEAPAWPLG